ncbi:Asp23/Gls24 family envelope stress response protein [Amycolatopsis suaedae]|nr:Asp23/Gls24 family envelope stress response protein [Amycolatopsis suaedae]
MSDVISTYGRSETPQTPETAETPEPIAYDDSFDATEDDAVAEETDQAETVDEEENEDTAEAGEETAEARPAAATRGGTSVDDAVVSKIVTMVTGKADGVHGVGDEGTSVTVEGDVARITVAVVVEFGHVVKTLAEQVRVDVIDAVEKYLGLDVETVDVRVTDVHFPEAG